MTSNSLPLAGAIDTVYRLNVGVIGTGPDRHERPHKPILLLTVLDGIDEGWARPDRVEWSSALRERFIQSFKAVQSANDEPTPENPFLFMRSDEFWSPMHLVGGTEVPLGEKPRVGDCDTGQIFGRFTPDWQSILADPSTEGGGLSTLTQRAKVANGATVKLGQLGRGGTRLSAELPGHGTSTRWER